MDLVLRRANDRFNQRASLTDSTNVCDFLIVDIIQYLG